MSLNIVKKEDRYIPTIGLPEWNIKEINDEEKSKIKSNLVVGITHDENEYRAILSYLHLKYPDLMDSFKDDGAKFQWRYRTFQEKVNAYDSIGKKKFDMYALVYYDADRDMEPVAVGGSYIRESGAIRDPYTHEVIENQHVNKHTTRIRCGHGYVLFIDPNYRRLGLARDQWLTEAQLYRDSNIYYQKENQTYDALQVTLSMFRDPSKCHLLSHRSLSKIKPGMNTKIIMDYFDEELENNFNKMEDNMKDFRNDLDWRFLERENLTFEELIKPWEEIDKKKKYNSKFNFSISVDRDLYEEFKNICSKDGIRVKTSFIKHMKDVVENYKNNEEK